MMLMSSLMIAFAEFEPRVEVRRINIFFSSEGIVTFKIEAVKKSGEKITILRKLGRDS